MMPESQVALRTAAAPTGARLSVTTAILVGSLLTGCGTFDRVPSPPPQQTGGTEVPIDAPDPILTLVTYHGILDQVEAPELRAAQRALAEPGDDPLAQMRSAMLLGHPRAPADMARARSLLEAVKASDHVDAIRLRPLARLLLAELRARMQLARDLERMDAQRKASDTARNDLQQKLDALTEIERSLPARPSADATPPAATEENKRP